MAFFGTAQKASAQKSLLRFQAKAEDTEFLSCKKEIGLCGLNLLIFWGVLKLAYRGLKAFYGFLVEFSWGCQAFVVYWLILLL